jgi:Ca2+-dependent lipid-binding protein
MTLRKQKKQGDYYENIKDGDQEEEKIIHLTDDEEKDMNFRNHIRYTNKLEKRLRFIEYLSYIALILIFLPFIPFFFGYYIIGFILLFLLLWIFGYYYYMNLRKHDIYIDEKKNKVKYRKDYV